jgi:organic hydroperoxide reductase OsmC/OhrA
MQGLPHSYKASAEAEPTSLVTTRVEGTADMQVAPPSNFGGPGNVQSPEDLQVAAVGSCLILSFKAIATASKLEWENLVVAVDGTLDQVDRSILFTGFDIRATLTLTAGSSREKAARLLEKAEQTCFISNSLKADSTLSIEIEGGE